MSLCHHRELRRETEEQAWHCTDCGLPIHSYPTLHAKIKALQQWVDDLQSGMYINCVYCGHRYGPCETTPVSMAEILKAHIEECPQHPLSELRAAVKHYKALWWEVHSPLMPSADSETVKDLAHARGALFALVP